ncbi:MAG TPA: class I SAM-dependent methyltransferase [Gaiellaceae bacterium]|nr:class I SAM-dependent methyltransferase [Gaiellaceae bacterium]
MKRLNDPEVVRAEYADEAGLTARMAAQQSTPTGLDPYAVVFEAVSECEPTSVLEVGCGRGELADRMARELEARVIAVDQSERMVELTAARGVEALVGDVQNLPFEDGTFDCAVAAWMLYHVPDLDGALRELRRVLRPDGRLVAATSSDRNLGELWQLIGERGADSGGFSAENAEGTLLRHFTIVERRDVRGTVTFEGYESARAHLAASPTRGHVADRLPFFEGPLVASRHVVVFVCVP